MLRKRQNVKGRNRRYQGTKREVTVKAVPKISTIAKKVKEIENTIELKYADQYISGLNIVIDPVDAASGMFLLNGLAQGTSQITRIGAQVRATSLQMRGYFITNSGRLNPSIFRMIIFWDQQANGGNPRVFGNGAGGGGAAVLNYVPSPVTAPRLFAPYQIESNKRYKILHDKTIVLNPQTDSGAGALVSTMRKFKVKIPLSRTVKYDGTANAVANMVTNSLWVVFIGDNNTNPAQCSFVSRMYFKDA